MTGDAAEAAAVLRAGGLVAFPTETVYGLGADATNASAVRRVFSVKGRPPDHPLIVHLASVDDLDIYAEGVSEAARSLARACWPGPLTLVVRLRVGVIASEVTGGRATVALRVPAHPVAHAVLAEFGGGVAAPSASPAILRLGGIDAATIDSLVGHAVERLTRGEVAAPGTLERHYSPAARVVVLEPGEVAARATGSLARGERVGLLAIAPPTGLPEGLDVLNPPRDVQEYARVLYARLREADERELDVVLVVAPPPEGIGAAVADRLARAAAGGRLP